MRVYGLRTCGALTPFCAGWLLLCAPVSASTFGVSLSSSGSAGDACYAPYSNAEGFSSGNLSGSYSLSYTGSAVGYDNSYPYPLPGPEGCGYSPAFANVAASGTAALGVLKGIASADMTQPLVGAGAGITEGWNDSFTAVSGGTYLLTFNLNAADEASPACPSSGPLTRVTFSNDVSVANYGVEDVAAWDYSECNASSNVPYAYGAATILNNNKTIQVTLTLSAGTTFAVSSSLGLQAGAGAGQSSMVDASDTAYLDIAGQNGATYSDASGTVYDYSDSGAPEPGTLGLTLAGAVAGVCARRRRFQAWLF